MISGRIKCRQPRKDKLMKEEFSTVNVALNILLSHKTKELSASIDKMIEVMKVYNVKCHYTPKHT